MTDHRDSLRALADALPGDAVVPVPAAWLRELLDNQPAPSAPEPVVPPPPVEDQSLTVEETAARLSVTPAWLYRHWRELPLGGAKLGRKTLRFSAAKVARYLEATRRRSAA